MVTELAASLVSKTWGEITLKCLFEAICLNPAKLAVEQTSFVCAAFSRIPDT